MITKQLTINDFHDIELICIDCGATFMFEAGEQLYFAQKGLATTKRCPLCRKYRKLTLSRGGTDDR